MPDRNFGWGESIYVAATRLKGQLRPEVSGVSVQPVDTVSSARVVLGVRPELNGGLENRAQFALPAADRRPDF